MMFFHPHKLHSSSSASAPATNPTENHNYDSSEAGRGANIVSLRDTRLASSSAVARRRLSRKCKHKIFYGESGNRNTSEA